MKRQNIAEKILFHTRCVVSGLCAVVAAGAVQASTIVLEGSDATGYHHDSVYTNQLFDFMKDGSSLPILVFGTLALSGAHADTVYTTDLSGLNNADYSGVYIQSPGGCCLDNRAGALVYETQIADFIDGGGSLSINDYTGGDWGTILDFVAPAATVAGWPTGVGPSCFDNEVFTADALAKGFTQPGELGCWGHQAYDMEYFGALGFLSLVDSGPSFDTYGSGEWSSFLALGGSLGTIGGTPGGGGTPPPTTAVPEPATLLLFSAGLVGFSVSRRRKNIS